MRLEQLTQRSATKSEILYIDRGESDVRVEDVQLRGQAMKTVEVFTYLGSVMASNSKFSQDIE